MSNNVHEVTTKITESLSGMFDSAEEEVVKVLDENLIIIYGTFY